jgi:hypothetical protein
VTQIEQLGSEALKRMAPAEINAARRAGQLAHLLAGNDPDAPEPEVKAKPEGPTPGGADQGARRTGDPGPPPDGLSWAARQRWQARRFFRAKSAEEIVAMRRRGELDEIMRDGFR